MAEERREFEDLADAYSRHRLPPRDPSPRPLEDHDAKGGDHRERTATEGMDDGPIDGHTLHDLIFNGVHPEILTEPPTEETSGRFAVQKDAFGFPLVYVRDPEWGTLGFKWTRVFPPTSVDLDAGGSIDVGGVPTQRPITVKAGSLTALPGAVPTKLDRVIGGSPMTVRDFTTGDGAGFQVILPEGYNLGTIAVRYLWYAQDGVAGTVKFGVQVKAVAAGESAPLYPATVESVSSNGGIDVLNVSPFVTATVGSTPGRSNQYHFLFIRLAGDTYPSAVSLSDIQILYGRDRHSDAVI